MFDQEFKYFLDHREELVNKYRGRFVVIYNNQVLADYETEEEAYLETIKKYEIGTFLIQQCLSEEETPKQIFNSRVIFA